MVAAAVFAQSIVLVNAAVTDEQVINSYKGTTNGTAVIKNLQYTDINNAPYDLRDAIYENGALDLLKGFGSRTFNENGYITNEMALYLVYMAANRSADIETQGQALNAARTTKKTNLQAVLFDGALQLAANDGLITATQLADAMQDSQNTLTSASFRRTAPVQRQYFATWLAKALLISPAYEQQELFNNYSDWSGAVAENVPFIEAILQNNIMSGDGNGKFQPAGSVTRGQAARILRNAEDLIIAAHGMQKKTATIENIQRTQDHSKGYNTDYNTILVRNSDGLTDEITCEARYQLPVTTSNELTGGAKLVYSNDIPVNKDGVITNSMALSKGDRIEYIVGVDDGIVRYARVLSNSGVISYKAVRVNSVNNAARQLNVTPLKQQIEYPTDDVSEPVYQTYGDGNTVYQNYSYSNAVINAVSKAPVNVSSIKPDSLAIVGIKNNMIVELQPITVVKEKKQGIIPGIVEENNPNLGYITLYNEDGSGRTPLSISSLRTFNYSDPNDVQVFKNYSPAELSDIEAGDTVFLRVDDKGEVNSINSVSNYTVRYGKVLSKKSNSVLVELDNKSQRTFSTDSVIVLKEGKLSKIGQLKDGDRVRLVINDIPNMTKLKEICIEGDERLASNIYKGSFNDLDMVKNEITIKDPWVLRKGNWVKDDALAFKTIKLDKASEMYYDGTKKSAQDINNYMKDTTVYIVGQKDYGNNETAVIASFVNPDDKEVAYSDKIYTSNSASNSFKMEKSIDNILYNPGSIIVKDGRLVPGSSISQNDYAYVVANRDSGTNSIVAGVVSIEQLAGSQPVQLVRGRISSINDYKSVTLQSYSRLNGANWDFANTPITYTLSSNTRITDTDGIIGQGDFITYGNNTFKDRTVYILCDGTNAVQISTASFGNYQISADVLSMVGATYADDGSLLTEPTSVSLRNCKYYNASAHLWITMGDSTYNLLNNSLIIKNNQIIKPSDIKKGDKLKILRNNLDTSGDAYVVIVED